MIRRQRIYLTLNKHIMNSKTIIVIATTIALGTISIFNKVHSYERDSFVQANIEALAWEETPNGVVYHCQDDFCLVFDYRNRVFLSGCRKEEGSICKVQATEFPGIDISL